jgi:hypothetical protein
MEFADFQRAGLTARTSEERLVLTVGLTEWLAERALDRIDAEFAMAAGGAAQRERLLRRMPAVIRLLRETQALLRVWDGPWDADEVSARWASWNGRSGSSGAPAG